MRRLWSYLVLAGTSLVLIGSTFANVFKNSTSNIEYSEGKEMVFRISNKDKSELETENANGKKPSEVIAQSMIERLDTLKVTNYEVSTESYDTVKVVLKQENNENYTNVQNLMTFNGSLALSSRIDDDPILDNSNEGEKFVTGKAHLESKNDYPSINIPVGDHFKELYDVVKQHKENGETDAAESSTTGEGDDAETTYTYNLYLWHDYEDGDKFSQTLSDNESYDPRVAEKVFMNFDIAELEQKEEDGESIDTLTAYVTIKDSNNNSKYEASEVRKAYDTARYYVALINSGTLDYKVTHLYSQDVPAVTEQLISVDGRQLAFSATLTATIVCIVIISILLAIFFRLGSLSIITMTIGSVYAAIGSIIIFTAEFNAAGLVALCLVALASLASGVLYALKVKDEAYRGRSLKKANSEAAKKSLLPILDINVTLIIIGVFAYVFGAALMRSFAIITVIGGLASLILNLLGLRGMMWLATNTTKLQGKYEWFGIDSKNVPNLLKEEKQTFYGAYAEKDFTKKKTPVGIFAAVLLVAGIAGMIVFGSINKGVVYNNGTTLQNSEIFIETDVDKTDLTEDGVRKVLANIHTYDKDESKAVTLESQVSEILLKTRSDIGETKDDTINYTYYIVKLNTKLDNSKASAYYVEVNEEGQEVSERIYTSQDMSLSDLITLEIQDKIDSEAKADLKSVKKVSTLQPEFAPVIWGTLVGIAVSAVYLMIRYRLSRGIAAFITSAGISAIVAGFFALTRLAVTNYAVVIVPAVAFFTLIAAIYFMNREREMVLEDKNHDNSVENRKEIMVRATSLSYSAILLIAVLAAYIGINFFGFGASNNAWLFLIFIFGVIVTIFLSTTLLGPIAHFFFKLFSKINLDKISSLFKRKKKKKVINTPRSAEPEERTFIGIND